MAEEKPDDASEDTSDQRLLSRPQWQENPSNTLLFVVVALVPLLFLIVGIVVFLMVM